MDRTSMIRTGKLVVNLGTRSATVDGKPLYLPNRSRVQHP
jgi:hypothetical protein